MAIKKGGLGKGLDVIFMENDTEDKNGVINLRISDIEPNKSQPRKDFNEEALAELADSISQHGILQPLLVRPIVGGGYQIVAGERRWRASRMAGIKEVPVVIKKLSDLEVTQIALIENLQREDLSPIEEAKGYKTLIDKYNFTQDEVSKSVGKSRPVITNALRLLTLPKEILVLLSEGKLTSGHARTLLSLKDEEDMIKTAELVVKNNLSVRELENLIKKALDKTQKKNSKKRNTFFDEVEISLKEQLGRKIKISSLKKEKGMLEIEFYSKKDLESLAKAIGDCKNL